MAIIKNPITVINKDSNIVNGIIEEYKAQTGTIDAGTFVEFIDSLGEDTRLSDLALYGAGSTYRDTQAVKLDNNRIFVAWWNTANDAYGVVCTISGTTITAGTPMQIATNGSGDLSAVYANTDTVFVSYRETSVAYGVVCTISGTTITVGTKKVIAASSSISSAVEAGAGKVFVLFRDTAVKGVVCTISGTTITVGTAKQIVASVTPTTVSMDFDESTGKVFIAYSRESNKYLYAVVCAISGSTFTAGTAKQITSTEQTTDEITATWVDANKAFVTHRLSVDAYGIVCSVSSNTITLGTDTKLQVYGLRATAVRLDTNKVLLLHAPSVGTYTLSATTCTISGTTITPGTDVELSTAHGSSSCSSAVLMSGENVFISHNNGEGGNLYGMIYRPDVVERTIRPSETKIDGLTRGACTTIAAGDVWVLNN